MSDKENKQEKEMKDTTEDSSLGCIFLATFLCDLPWIIIWIIWLIQGQPDNWYGKLYHFQWKAAAVLILLVIIGAVISKVIDYFTKKNTSNDDKKVITQIQN